MKNLGEYLKRTRLEKGVTLEEASDDLGMPMEQVLNIETGNTKAFKDIYKLKEYVISYAKYLGLDLNEVTDEFNNFIFDHTSKISIGDVLTARRKEDIKEGKKAKSPYTKEYVKKINIFPYIIGIIVFVLLTTGVFFLIKGISKSPERTSELLGEGIYEFTY